MKNRRESENLSSQFCRFRFCPRFRDKMCPVNKNHEINLQGRVQFSDLINAGVQYSTVLLFGRNIKYCVTNIGRKFPTSLRLYYDSTLQYHKSNTPALIK